MADIPIGLLDTLIAIIAGALFTLVGIIYRRLRNRIDELEEDIADIQSQLLTLSRDMDTAQTWMFGHDDDVTNEGIAQQIETINERLTRLIDALHDEEDLEFEREDVDE